MQCTAPGLHSVTLHLYAPHGIQSHDTLLQQTYSVQSLGYIGFQLTQWSRVLHEKLIVTQSRNSLSFMEPAGSLSSSQEPAPSACPEPDESIPHLSLFPLWYLCFRLVY